MTTQSGVCPSCRRDAPIVMRGIKPYCAACGAPRIPLEQLPVNVAGKPSKFGGTLLQAMGWGVVAMGTLVGVFLYWLFASVLEVAALANFLALPFTLFWLLLGGATVLGGRKLRKSGDKSEKDAHERALFSLAEARGGRLVVDDVAQALRMTKEEAEALLTELAKRGDDRVSLEVSDDGQLYYDFRKGRRGDDVWQRLRVADEAAPAAKVRVGGDEADEDAEMEQDARERGAAPPRARR